MLINLSASVISLGIGNLLLMPQYVEPPCLVGARRVGSSCPVVACRAKSEAKSDLSGRSSKSEAPSLKSRFGSVAA